MEAWNFIQQKLSTSTDVLLLWVLDSEGSSPGRRGFKMAVAADGSFTGTIGGGIMEHKLVEKAKSKLDNKEENIELQWQHHDKQHAKDQSGMICSGSQLVAFVPIKKKYQNIVQKIIECYNNHTACLVMLTRNGLQLHTHIHAKPGYYLNANNEWQYIEQTDDRPIIHIVGGGHVSLALSEVMLFLGFYIKLYDNRHDLSTFVSNRFAHEKHVVDYNNIGQLISSVPNEYVVIMTFGYRDDKIVFKQLLGKDFLYAGMMGSESKIATLFSELKEEGMNPLLWKDWFIPIGINIHSKTTKEIAVSVAAEIIQEKNKYLSTGRSG